MKSNVSRITSGAFAVGMLVGVSACVQLFDHSPDVKVRPVANMQDDKASPDSKYYLSAVSAINSRDYATALEYLQAARAKEPENIRVLNAFGVVYDKLGRFDLSARYYAQASALDPKSIIVAENLAYSKALQGISAPSVSQVASEESPPTATMRVADAQVVPASRVPTPAAQSAPPLPAPTAVVAIVQSSVSDIPARPSATTVAMGSPKPVANITPASLSSPRPAALNIARIAKMASPMPALPAHVSVVSAAINKTAPASVEAGVSKTPTSPVVSRVTMIAKSSAQDLPARVPATSVTVAPLKPVASIVPVSLSPPQLIAPAAATTVKTVVPDTSASVRPAHFSIVPAVSIRAAASVKADGPETPFFPAESRATAIAKSSATSLPARPAAMMVATVPPKSVASIAPAPLSLPPVAASTVKMAVPVSSTSTRPVHPSATLAVAIKAVAGTQADVSKTVLLTGYPLIVTDASGATDTVQSVRRNLAVLGWTISRAVAPNLRSQHDSILFYPPVSVVAANALARTLPFPVRMTVNQCHCGGLQLMIGSDVPGWKNVHRFNPGLRPKNLSVAAISNTTRMGVQ